MADMRGGDGTVQIGTEEAEETGMDREPDTMPDSDGEEEAAAETGMDTMPDSDGEEDMADDANISSASAPDPSMLDDTAPQTPTAIPPSLDDSSLLEDVPEDEIDAVHARTWQVIEGGTKRGGTLLVDPDGYDYVISKHRKNTTDWVCSVRSKPTTCKARATQRGEDFVKGSVQHCHPPTSGTATFAKVRAASKKTASEHPFQSAAHIVDEALRQHMDVDAPCDAMPQKASVERAANRHRQGDRPRHPSNLEFDVQEDAIPDNFFRADIQVGTSGRHLLFATTMMLTLLCGAKNWFVDATFRLVRAPFMQLFTVHAFVRQGDCLKQLPLLYVLMSGKTKNDYKAVLRTILRELPRPPRVQTITLDFEAAMWNAVRSVFPGLDIHGCSFHWTQAIWRKLQAVGLSVPYDRKKATFKFCKRLMALPFLPADNIRTVFQQMRRSVTTDGPLKELLEYTRRTWIESSVWPIASWSVYGRAIRTNNDLEGWHKRLNNMAGNRNSLNMYMLIHLLHTEATNVCYQVTFVSEGKLKRYQRRKYRRMQGLIFRAWEDFEQQDLSVTELLRICARLNGPLTSAS